MSSEDLKDLLAKMSADYKRALPAKFAELDVIRATLTTANLERLRHELHTLVGTAKTLGLPAVTDAARALEEFFEPYFAGESIHGDGNEFRMERLFDALKQSIK